MANDEDDSDAWGSKLDGKEAVQAGVSKEMLRKALALNPKMRGNVSTADIMNTLEKGGQARDVKESVSKPVGEHDDLFALVGQHKDRYQEARRLLKAERAALEAKEKALAPQTLQRVIDVMLRLDKNMTSIVTQELLRKEATFLSEIGFSASKITDRKLQLK